MVGPQNLENQRKPTNNAAGLKFDVFICKKLCKTYFIIFDYEILKKNIIFIICIQEYTRKNYQNNSIILDFLNLLF